MKKSLVITLALVFVLGIAGTALAANPFTDVPANHWAYAAVSKLAQEGVIEGYGDGRYFGNRTITRYEMAQIVAKAMANMDKAGSASRAQIEKLAAEYADELDSLGVRVAKLEKNADNVKITGEARLAYYGFEKKGITKEVSQNTSGAKMRSRIWVNGQVNDNWSYTALLEHHNDLHNNGNAGNDLNFRRAWVDGKIGAFTVTAGSFNPTIMQGTLYDADMDGLRVGYKTGKFSADFYYARPDDYKSSDFSFVGIAADGSRVNQNFSTYIAHLAYAFNDKANVNFAYYKIDGSWHSYSDADVFELGVDYRFNKDFMVWAEYIRGDKTDLLDLMGLDVSKNGWAAGLQFGQVDKNKPGTWQAWGTYYDVPSIAAIAPTAELWLPAMLVDGYKGWNVGATFVAAKNIDFNIEYFDFKNQKDTILVSTKEKLLWSYVRFYF